MKHYIIGTTVCLCMFYLAVGEIDRMSRAVEIQSFMKSRVKDTISY